jgi:signal recognition particle GTPase
LKRRPNRLSPKQKSNLRQSRLWKWNRSRNPSLSLLRRWSRNRNPSRNRSLSLLQRWSRNHNPNQPRNPSRNPNSQEAGSAGCARALSKSSRSLSDNITGIFTKRKLDADTIQDLEDVLIQSDLGVAMAMRITEEVARGRYDKEIDPARCAASWRMKSSRC